MQKLFAATALAAALMVGAASAATFSSQIKSIDTKGRTITFADGKVYQLAPGLKIDALTTGQKVSASYDQVGKNSVITKVVPAK